jgi:uncharacterized caspase-like protein
MRGSWRHRGQAAFCRQGFSGYGLQANRQTYLIPADAQIWREADVARDGTNLETVLADMNGQGAAVKLAIIDASRRNPYERQRTRWLARKRHAAFA